MTKKDELIDELLKGVKNPDDLFGKEGLLKQLTKFPGGKKPGSRAHRPPGL